MAFDRTSRSALTAAGAFATAALVAGLLAVPAASAQNGGSASSSTADLTVVAGDGTTGPLLVTAPVGHPVARPDGLPKNASAATVARAHLADVSGLWGVGAGTSSLRAVSTSTATGIGPVVRFAQLVDGVPVYGGQLVVSLDGAGRLQSVGGATAPADAPLHFRLGETSARRVALVAAAGTLHVSSSVLHAGPGFRYAYSPALVGGSRTSVSAVYRVVVAGPRGSDARAEVLVSAATGRVVSVTGGSTHVQRAVCDGAPLVTATGDVSSGSKVVNVDSTAGLTGLKAGSLELRGPGIPAGSLVTGVTATTVTIDHFASATATGVPLVFVKLGDSFKTDAAYGWCGENDVHPIHDTNGNGVLDSGDVSEVVDVPYARCEAAVAVALSLGCNVGGSTEDDGAMAALTDTSNLYTALGVDLTAYVGPTSASIGQPTDVGKTLAAIVNYCDPVEAYGSTYVAASQCPYDNAYWYADDSAWDPTSGDPYPGGQMFIGHGYESAVDVVGHEVTHGVTAHTNQLIYRGQPGAINESMSDVFGELTQQYTSPPGTDPTWMLGEDINGTSIFGAIRSMSDPTDPTVVENGGVPQPDSMTSSLWFTDPSQDGGGVHYNSGVGNKAAYLIAHGGTFNGITVAPLDTVDAFDSTASTVKVAKLYWAAQNLLPANADYRTLGATLDQACRQLVSYAVPGFALSDCANSVDKATAATRMTRTGITTSFSSSSIKYGKSVKVTVVARDGRAHGVGGVSVRLQRRTKGSSTWYTVGTGTTSTSSSVLGRRSWTVKPSRSTYYRATYAGGNGFAAVTSSAHAVSVTPTVSRRASATNVAFRSSFRVSGSVRPARPGQRVYLQRLVSGSWRTVASARLSSSSTYAVTYRPTSRGTGTYRVLRPSETSLSAGASAGFTVRAA